MIGWVLSGLLAASPAGLLTEVDALWAGRTPANRNAVAQKVIDKLKPHRAEFGPAWRLARAYCWLSERKSYYTDGAYKRRLGKKAMAHAMAAIKAKPKRVEGHYYYAWAVGQWSLGISIVKALWQGAEGKLRRSMAKAQKLDRSFDYFGVLRMWGRLFHALPWPKYDGAKALKFLREANRHTPRNLRGYVYLAESLISEGKNGRACEVVGKGLNTKPSTPDEPDWDFWQVELRRLKGGNCKKLLEDL